MRLLVSGFAFLAGLVACAASALPALAAFPERPVRIVLPFGAGGNGDVTARIVAEKLGQKLGQRFIVENQPGPGGMAAARSVLSAPRDGYTLAWLHSGTPAGVSLIKTQAFNPLKDFTPIGGVASTDHLIATNSNSSLKTFPDLLAAARAQPGKLNGGTVVVGSTPHLSSEYLKTMAAIDYQSVIFRTTPDLVVSVLRQDVDFVVDFFASMKAGLQDNKIRPLATTGIKRLPFMPDVPTVDESGVKGFEVSGWNALYAPVDIPKEAMDVLVDALQQVMVMPDVQERLLNMGIIADRLPPEAQTRRMASDIEKWRTVIRQANIPQQ